MEQVEDVGQYVSDESDRRSDRHCVGRVLDMGNVLLQKEQVNR